MFEAQEAPTGAEEDGALLSAVLLSGDPSAVETTVWAFEAVTAEGAVLLTPSSWTNVFRKPVSLTRSISLFLRAFSRSPCASRFSSSCSTCVLLLKTNQMFGDDAGILKNYSQLSIHLSRYSRRAKPYVVEVRCICALQSTVLQSTTKDVLVDVKRIKQYTNVL